MQCMQPSTEDDQVALLNGMLAVGLSYTASFRKDCLWVSQAHIPPPSLEVS